MESLAGWNIVRADDVEWAPWGGNGDARAKVLGAADGYYVTLVEAEAGYRGDPHEHSNAEFFTFSTVRYEPKARWSLPVMDTRPPPDRRTPISLSSPPPDISSSFACDSRQGRLFTRAVLGAVAACDVQTAGSGVEGRRH